MNPNYKVQLDVCLIKPIAEQNIWLRRMCYMPYVPREGDILRLTSEDEESTLDLTVDNAVYDVSSGMFMVDIEDETLVDQYRESGLNTDKEAVDSYRAFGFVRLNFPTAQAVR